MCVFVPLCKFGNIIDCFWSSGDKKLYLYLNIKNRNEWLSPKDPPCLPQLQLPQQKMMCVWWDEEGIVYYECFRHCWCLLPWSCNPRRKTGKASWRSSQHDNARLFKTPVGGYSASALFSWYCSIRFHFFLSFISFNGDVAQKIIRLVR